MSAADKTCGSTCPRNANSSAPVEALVADRHLVGKSLLVEKIGFVSSRPDLRSANRFQLQILYQR
jgi:hypothetical protein